MRSAGACDLFFSPGIVAGRRRSQVWGFQWQEAFYNKGIRGGIDGGLCRFEALHHYYSCQRGKVLATMRPMPLDEQMMQLKQLAQDREEKLGHQVSRKSQD